MNCPHCKAWSVVKETRGSYRKRECANLHKFWTEEKPVDPKIAEAAVYRRRLQLVKVRP